MTKNTQNFDALEAEALGAEVGAAFDQGGTEAVKALLTKVLSVGRAAARARLEAGDRGIVVARQLSSTADRIVRALHYFAATSLFSASNGGSERLAVIAVGGYGRGELAPYSDLDLLFLRPAKQTPFTEGVTAFVLYALWDLGLKVGQASRTIEECLKLARADYTIQTTLLEARLVAGDEALAQSLDARFRKEVAGKGHTDFIAAKLRERDERHARIGAARYMVEPNLKEGKGGLRDLHTLVWIIRRRYGFQSLRDYIKGGDFSREEFARLRRELGFLWTVRCQLHFLTERAEERLTFDVQPELAKRMGFRAREGHSAVERFMKRYFIAANQVGAMTRILCAKLEADHTKNAPRGLRRFLPVQRRAEAVQAEGFCIDEGRLNIESPAVLDAPENLIRLFEIAERRDLDVHPTALGAAAWRARRSGTSWRNDPGARAAFLNLLASSRHPGAALRLMNDAGVLGRLIPEFGRVVARMQFNMYHHYTVDEHTLQAIDAISEIERGRHKEQHPLATSIFPKIINRRALYLAMLLHDTGKGDGDQQVEGEKAARAACERLGLPPEEIDLVGWLVGRHLLMSDIAQKRDVTDPRTIAQFTQMVENVERLRLLLVLTVADMRAVGPGVWNDWKGQLLRDLYRLAEAALHGGRSGEEEVRTHLSELAADAKANLLARMSERGEGLAAWLDALEDGYWLNHDAEALMWHANEVLSARISGELPHAAARLRPEQGVTELLVYAADRPGLFASLAAAISASGANIASARVHTTKDGVAFDVFLIQTTDKRPFGQSDPRALAALLQRLRGAALDDHTTPVAPQPSRRASVFVIEPWVRIDNEVTPQASVIEASGRDRLGLLADLARVCAEAGISIVSAHIDTAGERASDVFYVQEASGGQIASGRRAAKIRAGLEDVLRAAEPAAPASVDKPPLAVGRASTAR